MKNDINKIEDFGQKIGGARKDYYSEAREAAAQYLAAANVEALKSCASLGALVKLPHLATLTKNGAISAEAARAVLVLYRTIERKPSRTWRAARWAEQTAPTLAQIADLLQGGEVSAEVAQCAEFEVLTAAGWPANDFNFASYSCDRVSASSFAACYERVGIIRIIRGARVVARVTTAAEAVEKINEFCKGDSARRADGPKLEAHKNRAGVWYIHPVGKKEIAIKTLDGVTDTAEVRRIMCEERAALIERYRILQSVPDLRRDWNRPRVGEDWRKGENVTPESFAQALPFRGVEFGNWVTQAERASLLNAAFDGFHDLAQLFGLSAENMTLSGSLAFAFASRGKSGAMAHYEPLRQVINLTKKNGAGCMAHEWFHALDNWAQYSEGRTGYATEAAATATTAAERAGFALLQAIRKTEFFRRSCNLAAFKGDYWIKAIELAARGFEGVCAFLLRVSGVCSDFLVNCLDLDEFTAKDVAHRSEFYPYPTEAEAATLAPYYFAFLRAIFGDGVQMSESVRREVERLSVTAQNEQSEAQAERDAQHAAEEAKRAEMMAAAKDHAAALTAASRAKVEAKAEEVKAETGADWSHVFESGGKCYAIGGGRGFVFLVYASGAVSYRLIQESNRIKKDFRPSHRYFIDVRRGVDLRAVMVADANGGFCPASLCYELFKYSYAMSWADFSAKFADELAAAKGVKAERVEITEAAQPAQKTESAPVQAADTTDEAPAEGLQLVETAEGVAVVGDSRTTYRNRKQIKAHGARWNKTAQQWQASEQEAVARLREWFGANNTPTAEEADTANESEQPGSTAPTAEQFESSRKAAFSVIFAAREIGATEWNESGYYTGGTAEEWEDLEAVAPEAVTAWKEADQPLNYNMCARLYGADLTKEAQDAHTVASHRAKYCEEWRDELREIWAIYKGLTTTDSTTDNTTDNTPAQIGADATLCEGCEISETAPTDTAEDFADVVAADRLELLRGAAADFDRMTQAGEHIAAVNARLSALFACGVDVADLVQCADYKADQRARQRAAAVLTADEFRTLYGSGKEVQGSTEKGESTPPVTPTEQQECLPTASAASVSLLCEAGEIIAPAPNAERLALLRYVAADLRKSGRSKNPLDALRARLYALNALRVEVYDLMTLAASISPESVGERSATSCALEVIQRLSTTADRRAAEALTPDEWRYLFGTPHPKQHAAA